MTDQTVTVKVPPVAGHLALLRTAVAGFAAYENFTLDQVDDLRMAVEEAAVQLLRKAGENPLTLEVVAAEPHLQMRLSADVTYTEPVIDPESFSWMILRALADDLHTQTQDGRATITLTKRRTTARAGAGPDDSQGHG